MERRKLSEGLWGVWRLALGCACFQRWPSSSRIVMETAAEAWLVRAIARGSEAVA